MTHEATPNIELLLTQLEEGSFARVLVSAYRDHEAEDTAEALAECLDVRLEAIKETLRRSEPEVPDAD
jgi:hypothetical protein